MQDVGRTIFQDDSCGCKTEWQYLHSTTMQFSAYVANGSGLYFDTRDKYGYFKSYCYEKGDRNSVRYACTHLMPLEAIPPRTYALPYPSTCAIFQGDWFAAAEIYRTWALRQEWSVSARARRSGETASKVRNLALWVWNRGSIEEAARPVEWLADRLGLPVAFDWYWWHRNPYDAEYPRYLPPREGEEAFKSAVRKLKSKGVFTQVYINGMMWDQDDVSWEDGGRQSVVIKEDGEPMSGIFNTYMGHRLAYMCGGGRMFRETIVALAKSIKALGLDGLYLDVIGTACMNACYNPEHGHPLGGGTYQVEGFRKLLGRVHEACPGMPLSSESCGEMYIGLLDAGIMLDPSWERFGYNTKDHQQIIPLFNAVYHGLFPLFGNYALVDAIPPWDPLWPAKAKWKNEKSWNELCPEQFFLEIARTVIWGLQPTVANMKNSHVSDKRFKKEIDFLCHAVQFYYENRDSLLDGRMLPPGEIKADDMKVSFLKRMIFTKEGEEIINKKTVPAVIHSVWLTKDGAKILILANYTSVKRSFCWRDHKSSCKNEIDPHSFMKIAL